MQHLSHRSVFYQTAVMSGSGLILAALGFFYRLIQSRLAGADGMGLFSLIMPVYGTVVALSLSGITVSCNHLTAEVQAKGYYGEIPVIFRVSARLFVGLFLIMGGGIVCFREYIAEYLLKKPGMADSLILFLPCIFLTGFENICKGVFYGLREIEKPVRSELGEQSVRIIAVWLFLLLSPHDSPQQAANRIILGMTVSEVFSSAYMTFQLGRLFDLPKIKSERPITGRSSARRVAAMALPVSIASVAGSIVAGLITVRLPLLLEESGLGGEEAISMLGKINGMASPLLCLPLTLIGPISSAIAPRLTAARAVEDRSELCRKTAKSLEAAGIIALPLLGMLAPVSRILLKILFHVDIEERHLFILCLSVAIAAYQGITGAILTGFGLHRWGTFFSLAGSILQLFLMGLWIPKMGIEGYLWAGFMGNLVPFLGNLALIKVPIHPFRAFLRPMLLGGVLLMTERAVMLYMPTYLWTIIPALLTGGTIGILVLWIYGYKPKAYLRTLVPKGKTGEKGGTF